ncbi:MAG: TonB-dependent receptor [Pseudomonadota bacterium]
MTHYSQFLKSLKLTTAAIAVVWIASGHSAAAQDQDDTDYDALLEEIIVSASGRDKGLQDTAISITAFSTEQVERFGIENFADLAARTPGLFFSNVSTLTDNNPIIRGVGTPRAAGAPTVGVFIDGIDIGNSTFNNVPTFDLERIEVVRGPQSALFGRGVLAGAINYITRRPSFDEVSGNFQATAAQGGEYVISARVEGPITDRFSVSAAVRDTQFDGFFDNTVSGNTIGGRDAFLGNIAARLKFGGDDQGEAYLRVSYAEEVQEQPAWHQVPSNNTDPTWFIGEVAFDETLIANNGDDYAGIDREFVRLNLIVNYDFGGVEMISRSSYSDLNFLVDQDIDFTAQADLPFSPSFLGGNFRFLDERDIEDFSQEIRFLGEFGDRFEWIAGAYYRNEDFDNRNFSFTTNSVTPDPVNPNLLDRDLETLAFFGSLRTIINDKLSVTSELRWAQDKVTESSQPRLAAEARDFSETFDNILPRIIAEYTPNDDILIYASAAKGSKPGGFNNTPGAGLADLPDEFIPFDEEQAWSYEIGAKTQFFDNRLTFNAAVFYIDWTDIQVNGQFEVNGQTRGFTDNANTADSLGFEAEFTAAPFEYLNLYGGFSYSPIRIDDFVDRRVAAAGIVTDGEDQLANTPDWTANFGATYRRPINDEWDWYVQSDLSYRSTLFASTANLAETGAQTLVDLFAGIESEKFGFNIFVRNLFDNDTAANVAPFVDPSTFARTFIVQAQRPRQIGGRVTFNF